MCLSSSVVRSHSGSVALAALLLLVCLAPSTGGFYKPSGSVAPFAAARLDVCELRVKEMLVVF